MPSILSDVSPFLWPCKIWEVFETHIGIGTTSQTKPATEIAVCLKMPSSLGAPQQHQQPSRKGKKAWRKNVDITEVQQGLESLREEIIQGGPVAEKPSEELFALDTKGSDEIKRK